MVFNRSRVIPARLHGTETRSGARVEVLLVRRLEPGIWQALGRPGRRLRATAQVVVASSEAGDASNSVTVEILETHENGLRTVRLSEEAGLDNLGEFAVAAVYQGNTRRPGALPDRVRRRARQRRRAHRRPSLHR